MIKGALKYFRRAFGEHWKFTEKQEDILQKINSSFTVLDCTAGSGKTTIFVALAVWMLSHIENGVQGCLHYVTETQEMVMEFIDRVREVTDTTDGVAPIGYDREKQVDRLDDYLKKQLQKRDFPHAKEATLLEKALHFLANAYNEITYQDEVEWEAFSEIFKAVLIKHHIVLHLGFYCEHRKAGDEELLGIRVVAYTTANASRLNASLSSWSRMFNGVGKTIAVYDEVQNDGRVQVAGIIIRKQFASFRFRPRPKRFFSKIRNQKKKTNERVYTFLSRTEALTSQNQKIYSSNEFLEGRTRSKHIIFQYEMITNSK